MTNLDNQYGGQKISRVFGRENTQKQQRVVEEVRIFLWKNCYWKMFTLSDITTLQNVLFYTVNFKVLI